MRIATWNVNSIGARLPRLLDWLQTRRPVTLRGWKVYEKDARQFLAALDAAQDRS